MKFFSLSVNQLTSTRRKVSGLNNRFSQRVVEVLIGFLSVLFLRIAEKFKAMASQAMAGSPAEIVAMLDSL